MSRRRTRPGGLEGELRRWHRTAEAWARFIHLKTRADRKLAMSVFVTVAYLSGWLVWRLV